MSEPSFNEHQRPPLRNPGPYVPKKEQPVPAVLLAMLIVGELVTIGLIVWQWKAGRFWTGFRSGSSLLFGLIVCNLMLLYRVVRDKMDGR